MWERYTSAGEAGVMYEQTRMYLEGDEMKTANCSTSWLSRGMRVEEYEDKTAKSIPPPTRDEPL